jgi:hypothetical protein
VKVVNLTSGRIGGVNDLEVRANGIRNDVLDLRAGRGQECQSRGIIGLLGAG